MNTIDLLFTICFMLAMPDEQHASSNSCKPASFVGWYRVTQSDRPDVWDIQSFSIQRIQGEKDGALLLTGFSNQGFGVQAMARRCTLKIPRQSQKILPKGGEGQYEWEVQVQGIGKLRNGVLEITYELLFLNTGEKIESSIIAEKIPDDKF